MDQSAAGQRWLDGDEEGDRDRARGNLPLGALNRAASPNDAAPLGTGHEPRMQSDHCTDRVEHSDTEYQCRGNRSRHSFLLHRPAADQHAKRDAAEKRDADLKLDRPWRSRGVENEDQRAGHHETGFNGKTKLSPCRISLMSDLISLMSCSARLNLPSWST